MSTAALMRTAALVGLMFGAALAPLVPAGAADSRVPVLNSRVQVLNVTSSDANASFVPLGVGKSVAIDQQLEEKNGQKVVVGKTATLELTPGQVEIVTLARQTGTLSLALRSITDAGKATIKSDDDKGKRDAVNVVRFGVGTVVTPR